MTPLSAAVARDLLRRAVGLLDGYLLPDPTGDRHLEICALLADVEAALSAYSTGAAIAALAGDGWQPIETAPDDISVLIYVPPFTPMQGTRSGRFGTWMIGARSIFGRDLVSMTPTHWQPLPEPPL